MAEVMQEFPQDRERVAMAFRDGLRPLADRLLQVVEQRAEGVSADDLVREMLKDPNAADEREIESLLRQLIDRGELRLGQRLRIVRN